MRLVCDKCSAVYTIDDSLVGSRDFRVSCKGCGKPIIVKSAKQVSYAATQRVKLPGAALPPPSLLAKKVADTESEPPAQLAAGAGEGWFITQDGDQQGPFTAAQLASMFEAGTLDWGTEVWRQGLKDWRAARRDPMLVTAVAGARGVANDTTRLDAARSFLAPEDTVVEARPHPLRDRPSLRDKVRPSARPPADTLPPAPPLSRASAKPEALPDLSPSARPQAWHSPENMAFREALGLPTDSAQHMSTEPPVAAPEVAANPAPANPAPAQVAAATRTSDAVPPATAAAATLGAAFGSVPELLSENRLLPSERVAALMTTLEGLPARVLARVDSHYLVGAGAFFAGVLCTLLFTGNPSVSNVQPVTVAHAESAPSVPSPAPVPAPDAQRPLRPAQFGAEPDALAVMPVTTVQTTPIASALPEASAPLRELPTADELRAEVRKVGGDVRRCLDNPSRGVDVTIYLDGPSGRVRDLEIRAGNLGPGRVVCVTQAVRRMQLSPFARDELKLMHKFSW